MREYNGFDAMLLIARYGSASNAMDQVRMDASTNSLQDPTSIATDGTLIAGHQAGANRNAGSNDRNREHVLKQNTLYLYRFTSTATSNSLDFCGEWYEHIDKH
jgi:hypothetical protein